jgi:Protein of unknown function (DUF2599)
MIGQNILKKILFVFLVLTCLIIGVNANAQSYNYSNIKYKNLIDNIKLKDPTKAVTNKFVKDTKNKNKLNSNQDSLNIDFDTTRKQISLKRENKKDFKINLTNKQIPEIIDGKLIYSDTNTQTVIEPVDGGVRQVLNIKSIDAPTNYTFPMELEIGDYIKLNNDGSANVIGSDSKTKIFILKPWAVDANQKQLKTWYTVSGNSLIQNIDFKEAIFPVLADPLWCGDVVSSVKWTWRTFYNSGSWSLSIKPTWCGINMSGPTPWASWEEVYWKTPYHSAWPYPQAFATNTYWSMYNQYVCHTDWKAFAYLWDRKNPWDGSLEYNLEPWRSDKGYWGFVNSQCN